MRWMNLEPIIQSEVSQKEKDKYHILYSLLERPDKPLINWLHWPPPPRKPGICHSFRNAGLRIEKQGSFQENFIIIIIFLS